MSDQFDSIDEIKFEDKISFVHQSPHLKHDFLNQNRLALTISITHTFLSKLHDATRETGLSYIDILNTQLASFQIQTSERLEKRFASISNKVKSVLKGRKGRKRQDYLDSKTSLAIFETELFNVRELSCSLDRFNEKSIELEKQCSELLQEMQSLQANYSEVPYDNSLLSIDMNSFKLKHEKLNERCNVLLSENVTLKETIDDMSDDYQVRKKERDILKSEISNLESGNQQLIQYIDTLEKTYLPQTRKPVNEVRTTNRARQLRIIGKEAEKALWFAETYDLKPKVLTCSTESGDVSIPLGDYRTLDTDDKQKLKELLYILDKFSISDAAYHELTIFSDSLPRRYLIVQKRSELNEIFHIERTFIVIKVWVSNSSCLS